MNSLHEEKLLNGVTVYLYPMPQAKYYCLYVGFRAGPLYESAEESGLSHFLEHMLFRKSRNISELVQKIERAGFYVNAYTSTDKIVGHVSGNGDLKQIIEYMYELVCEPDFVNDHVVIEKEVVKQEFRDSKQDIGDTVDDDWVSNVFPGHPVTKPILGTMNAIQEFSLAKVESIYQRLVKGSNLVVVLTGKFDLGEAKDSIAKSFSKIEMGLRPKTPPLEYNSNQARSGYKQCKTSESFVSIGFFHGQGVVSQRENYIGDLASEVFGEGMSSPLFKIVRDRHGLCYSIGSSSYEDTHDTHWFMIDAVLSHKKIAPLFCAVKEAMDEVKHSGIDVEDFQGVIKKSQLGFELYYESPKSCANSIISYVLEEDPSKYHFHTYEEAIGIINSIRVDEINSFLNERIFVTKPVIRLIVPKSVKVDMNQLFIF